MVIKEKAQAKMEHKNAQSHHHKHTDLPAKPHKACAQLRDNIQNITDKLHQRS